MAEKKITKKIISKVSTEKAKVDEQVKEVKRVESHDGDSKTSEGLKPKKVCYFCQGKNCPNYTDIASLRKYLTDRAKIVARAKSGVCSKHQRAVTKQVKYARHLALLPFTPRV